MLSAALGAGVTRKEALAMERIDQATLQTTRRSLHALAELVVAGPQYARSQDIRLRATPGGFGTVGSPDIRIDGLALVTTSARVALTGTVAEVAAAAGIEPRSLADVYADTAELGPHDTLEIDEDAAARLAEAFAIGDEALRALSAEETPVLWPEHFDIGISLGEVNFGVSPGDVGIGVPYAYVGPWKPREGDFWNVSFGAARPIHELGTAGAVLDFFAEGRALAESDS
jgi:hypothetical protein